MPEEKKRNHRDGGPFNIYRTRGICKYILTPLSDFV